MYAIFWSRLNACSSESQFTIAVKKMLMMLDKPIIVRKSVISNVKNYLIHVTVRTSKTFDSRSGLSLTTCFEVLLPSCLVGLTVTFRLVFRASGL